ncbi:hypothetical protein OEZ86_000660 [Tetradesmus obliquus]|uniref:Uncharacterized protein n=2 Tax=Tetradesmus obliquus TaxID=3088 RepID=A0ABY8TNE0_TETOB|nr:hypothetical protein OEZ85_010718 [Tetradesmus obliquus]WIA30577.1 hypothetical protein OEZ86_000660 [Tetradesmus obliquus]|eukprot:jgi/Sobl393_1/1651/SZX78611.1
MSASQPAFTDYIEFEHSENSGNDSDEETLLFPGGVHSQQHEERSFFGLLTDIWRPGADAESSRVNHSFSTEEKRKLNLYESIDYFAPNSAVYRRWLARQPHRRAWDRWLMMGSIGVTTGLVAYSLYVVINALAEFKYGITRWLLLHTNLFVAWLFNTTVSLALVGGSSALVVGWAPAAVSSGVPEVMAYLNGILLPKVFNIFTVVVKFASCALAVASGLPVGPEGPMIHIGAALGAALSQGHSTTLGFSTKIFRRFRNPKDKRDFVTAGVAVGVATAFNAPIGGLLFAFEEVASFWQHSLGWQIFFACMCATLTLNLSRSAGKALFHSGSFGWFNQDVVFEAGVEISAHILAIVPAAVVGLLCGVLGIGFTLLNLKIARFRDATLSRYKWRRCIEPCVLVVVYVTGTMLLPRMFPCTPTRCVTYQNQVYCGIQNVTAALNGTGPPTDTPPLQLPLYTCSTGPVMADNGTWIPSTGTITPDSPTNASAVVFYNELATLMLNTGDETIKHLVSRGAHRRFSYQSLMVMLAWYFLGAAVAAGSAISSGLFVPMLMMGAILGRIVGLATTDIADKYGQLLSSWTMAGALSNPWSWIDPGAFALVGAGAFMSSVTRLTIALAVIMVEISDDVHMLLPVLVAIMVAKWVADAATHSLYHALLEVKCAPFLVHEPVSKFSLELLPVSTVMRSPVVTLELHMKVADIQAVLRDTSHNGYPVVRDSSAGQICLGLVTRGHLLALLQQLIDGYNSHGGTSRGAANGVSSAAAAAPHDGDAGAQAQRRQQQHQQPLLARQLSWSELNRKMMEPVEASRAAPEQQMVAIQNAADWEIDLAPGLLSQVVDLSPYVNSSALKVQETMSLQRAYILFRNMGLRHLVVVDEHNRVRGIVTRKDLLGFKLDEAVGRALRRVESAQQLGQANWLSSSPPATPPNRSAWRPQGAAFAMPLPAVR